jgi:acetyl esterase/lipase
VVVDGNGTVHLPPMSVPISGFVSPRGVASLLAMHAPSKLGDEVAKARDVVELRRASEAYFQPMLERTREMYPTVSVPGAIAGVYADIITPRDGVAPRNEHRVLINLHGGGFFAGTRTMGALESIPVASIGRIKVVALDYRQGPEYKFPAASEDVAAAYKELLRTYRPENVGIYGCSAGGMLTAEVMAWIEKDNLPTPGALGIFCAAPSGWSGGDSGVVGAALMGINVPPQFRTPRHPSVATEYGDTAYFSDADFNDPLVVPLRSNEVMSRFPPTLIITSTRDPALSPAVYTHTQMIKLGVDAELHVWEGLDHGFFTTNPNLPESRDVWTVVTKFFDRHLGT